MSIIKKKKKQPEETERQSYSVKPSDFFLVKKVNWMFLLLSFL